MTHWFEESILGGLPQYRMVKSLAEGLTQIESGDGMQPVLMRGDEGWMLGYQMEELPGGWRVDIPASLADADVGQRALRRGRARQGARHHDARGHAAGETPGDRLRLGTAVGAARHAGSAA